MGSNRIIELAREHGLSPGAVALELIESRAISEHHLQTFSAHYSNLERVVILQPDIIKIDRSLTSSIHADYFRQSIVRSVVGLAQSIGALSLAEGVETRDEIECCVQNGVDLVQGYHFSPPVKDVSAHLQRIQNRVTMDALELTERMQASVKEAHKRIEALHLLANSIAEQIIHQPLSAQPLLGKSRAGRRKRSDPAKPYRP